MPAEYVVSDRLTQIGTDIIKQHRNDISGARICYLMKKAPEGADGPKPPARMGKHPVMARARKVAPLYEAITGFDFIIEVDELYWDILTLEQQEALIDHELSHCAIDEKGYYLIDHDFEDFLSIVDRHGCWKRPLPELRLIMQTSFSFDDPKAKEAAVRIQ